MLLSIKCFEWTLTEDLINVQMTAIMIFYKIEI